MLDQRERNARIVEMVQGGTTFAEVGRQLGITRERVRQIARAAGCRKRRVAKVSESEAMNIVDMAERGLCASHIAQSVGRSWYAVKQILRRKKISARDGHDTCSPELRARAVSMVKNGATYAEAADALGLTRNIVAGACHRAGVKKRQTEGAQ